MEVKKYCNVQYYHKKERLLCVFTYMTGTMFLKEKKLFITAMRKVI